MAITEGIFSYSNPLRNLYSGKWANPLDSLPKEEEKDSPLPSHEEHQDSELPILLVGKKKIAAVLQRHFEELNVPMQTAYDSLRWTRDCRVRLPNRTHLIPAYVVNEERGGASLFNILLPSPLLHFYWDNLIFAGLGYSKEFRKKAISTAQGYHLPYKTGKTCIEGGNCHIFTASDKKPKAIIGYTSLILSFISLHTQGYFTKPKHQKKIFHAAPKKALTEDLFRIAKNLFFFAHDFEGYLYDITELANEEDFPALKPYAHQTYQMIELTKEKISKELQIPLERIAFIFQRNFHIDMETFVIGPYDLVFVQDEKQTVEFLKTLDHQEMPFLKKILEFSKERLKNCQIILERNTKILENIGCKAVPVPGVLSANYLEGETFSSSYLSSSWTKKDCIINGHEMPDAQYLDEPASPQLVNFMNGIFLEKPTLRFITIGTEDHRFLSLFQQIFCQKIHEACPELDILFLTENLLQILIRDEGGLHCLTSEI